METLDKLIEKLSEEKESIVDRFVGDDFEAKSRLEPVNTDTCRRRRRRKEEPKILDVESQLALDALKLRDVLDPARFYKKKATDNISKDFQIGTVISHPIDHYSGRVARAERKQTLVDELILDNNFQRSLKKRYNKIKSKKNVENRVKKIIKNKRQKKGQRK